MREFLACKSGAYEALAAILLIGDADQGPVQFNTFNCPTRAEGILANHPPVQPFMDIRPHWRVDAYTRGWLPYIRVRDIWISIGKSS